jgi:hypothetical protein
MKTLSALPGFEENEDHERPSIRIHPRKLQKLVLDNPGGDAAPGGEWQCPDGTTG